LGKVVGFRTRGRGRSRKVYPITQGGYRPLTTYVVKRKTKPRRTSHPLRQKLLLAGIEPGSHLYTTWGYDQTNVDFVKVIDISKTGKTLKCKMASRKYLEVEDAAPHEVVVPGEAYGETFSLRVRESKDGKLTIVGSYPFARGAKRRGYFSKWDRKYALQTMKEFGH